MIRRIVQYVFFHRSFLPKVEGGKENDSRMRCSIPSEPSKLLPKVRIVPIQVGKLTGKRDVNHGEFVFLQCFGYRLHPHGLSRRGNDAMNKESEPSGDPIAVFPSTFNLEIPYRGIISFGGWPGRMCGGHFGFSCHGNAHADLGRWVCRGALISYSKAAQKLVVLVFGFYAA